jgi:hypothetical protein
MANSRPKFVDQGGKQTFAQPFTLDGTQFRGFLLDADPGALGRVLDRSLNDPAGGAVCYRPLAPFVLLGYANNRKMRPAGPEIGWMPEKDIAFWIPAASIKDEGGVQFIERVAWFLTYVFVDNAWACASGREIYGFAKEMSTIETPAQGSLLLSIDTLAFERYAPEAEAVVQRILEVNRRDGGPLGALESAWGSLDEAFRAILGALFGASGSIVLPGLGLAAEIWEFLTQHEVPLVFLKQFRDAANGSLACYQAVVEALAKVLAFHSGGFLAGDYTVAIRTLESHPIVTELGLVADPRSPGTFSVKSAFAVEFDFVLENGREVWHA